MIFSATTLLLAGRYLQRFWKPVEYLKARPLHTAPHKDVARELISHVFTNSSLPLSQSDQM